MAPANYYVSNLADFAQVRLAPIAANIRTHEVVRTIDAAKGLRVVAYKNDVGMTITEHHEFDGHPTFIRDELGSIAIAYALEH